MSESPEDRYSRVVQMIIDENGTWDLSPNDKEALRHVLGLVNYLADKVAWYDGTTVPDVMRKASKAVATEQDPGGEV